MRTSAIPLQHILDALKNGPITQEQLKAKMPYGPWTDDPRWLGITVHRALADGVIRMKGCAANHNHGGKCLIERAP
jgi:hypothetical protein